MRLFPVLLFWFVMGYLCGVLLSSMGYVQLPILLLVLVFLGSAWYYTRAKS